MKKLIGYVLPETKIDNSSSLDKAICFPWLDLQSLDSSLDCEDVISPTQSLTAVLSRCPMTAS